VGLHFSFEIAGIVTAHCNGSVGDTEREELGENPLELLAGFLLASMNVPD
jgi:hypothetical protein